MSISSTATVSPPVTDGREQVPLLLARVAFAVLWAAAVVLIAPGVGVGAALLLALYPLADVVLLVLDARRSGPRGRIGLVANGAVSALAALALAGAATHDVPSVLRVWGAWAVVSGLGQLVVALSRRRVRRGQWSLVVSGGLSCVVGVAFVAMAAGPAPMLTAVAGYAVAGAVFALFGALRLVSARPDA